MNGANIKKILRFIVPKICRTAGISLAINYFKTSYFYLEHLPNGSESTAFRVASAVAQRNDGVGFISKVYDHLHLSPGDNTSRYIGKENRKREYQRQQKQAIEYKKRRRELKSSKTQQDSTSEIKEWATYQPAVDLEPSQCSTDEIPSQLQPPTSSAHIVNNAQSDFLFFDLETTGLECGNLEDHISGFADSLHVFKDVLPGRTTYRLESLVSESMAKSYDAHSATEDVKILQSLTAFHNVSEDILLKHSFNLAFQRGGAEGIENILGEKNDDGQVRATRTKSVIAKIFDHFNALNQKE
ncbi:uncharacterized protein LOC144624578 [Crassostrea virginica]